MIRAAFSIIGAIGLGWASMTGINAVNPPPPEQRNPDVYEIAGWPSPKLQTLNPITQKLKAGARTITFSYVVVNGCNAGNMRQTLQTALDSTSKVTGITFSEVVGTADIQVRATCGVDAANSGITGAVIADLYPGWPYQSIINASTTMSTFYNLSQVAIWEHEFAGHGLGTWNEQYVLGGSFGNTPGLVDFMNTGPDSRYDWPQNDIDRWERTMYSLQPVPEWGDCNADANNTWCWSNKDQLWHLTQWQPTEWRSNGGPWFCVAHCP